MGNAWLALGLTLLAGLATGIGSAIAFLAPRTNFRFLSVATGMSAGVMLYVSFVELHAEATAVLVAHYGGGGGRWLTAAAFFGGMLLIGLIDLLIPAAENPHEIHPEVEFGPLHDPAVPAPDFAAAVAAGGARSEGGLHMHGGHRHRLQRMGMFTALAIGIHNFPEGLATFFAALDNPHLGVAIAIAIALHNLPEGISVSVPIYFATGNRRRAFLWSVLSGLAEPVGAGVACLALVLLGGGDLGGIPRPLMGMLFAGVAGIMVYISIDELLPVSRAHGKGHDSLLGLVAGMVVMAASLSWLDR
jgi:ZIP family zinc transporter